MTSSAKPLQNDFQSFAEDAVGKVAGLQDIQALVDADATIQAESSSASSASSENVSGSSAAVSTTESNQAIGESTSGASSIEVKADAGLQGVASSTASSSASTSNGIAEAFTEMGEGLGVSLTKLDVGGELSGLGQSSNSLSADSESVTDDSTATSGLTGSIQGFNSEIQNTIDSDASIQGLAQLVNNASAASTGTSSAASSATAIADASKLQGADLGSNTDIGGVADIGGQVDFNATAASTNVTGSAAAGASLGDITTPVVVPEITGDVSATLSTLAAAGALDLSSGVNGGTAEGLVTGTDTTLGANEYSTDIKSDGTLQGFANLSNTADASTTDGAASAGAYANTIDGANLGDVNIGGVGSLTGSANFAGSASSSNVGDEAGDISGAVSQLNDIDGLEATAGLNVAVKDVGIPTQADHAFLNAGSTRVVEANHRCSIVHGQVHHPANLLRMGFGQRAPQNGKVLTKNVNQTAIHPPITGHHTVPQELLLVEPKKVGPVGHQHSQLLKSAFVEQQGYALTGGQLALSVLDLDALFSSTHAGFSLHRLKACHWIVVL